MNVLVVYNTDAREFPIVGVFTSQEAVEEHLVDTMDEMMDFLDGEIKSLKIGKVVEKDFRVVLEYTKNDDTAEIIYNLRVEEQEVREAMV